MLAWIFDECREGQYPAACSEVIDYQVTADMTSEATFEREMRPLRQIRDNYEKIVLTPDRYSLGNYEGIKVINVCDWLLG